MRQFITETGETVVAASREEAAHLHVAASPGLLADAEALLASCLEQDPSLAELGWTAEDWARIRTADRLHDAGPA